MIAAITPTLIIKCLKCTKDKAAALSDGCVRIEASLRSRWILCAPCAPPFGSLPGDLQRTHLPNIADSKYLNKSLRKFSLMRWKLWRKRSTVFPPRGDQATQAATAEVRTEVNVSAAVSWCAFLCLTLCLPEFKLPFTQLHQIKWYIW